MDNQEQQPGQPATDAAAPADSEIVATPEGDRGPSEIAPSEAAGGPTETAESPAATEAPPSQIAKPAQPGITENDRLRMQAEAQREAETPRPPPPEERPVAAVAAAHTPGAGLAQLGDAHPGDDAAAPALTTGNGPLPSLLDGGAAVDPHSEAKAQHDAWVAQQISNGWGYGPKYDVGDRRDPRLVAYENLPHEPVV